MRITFISEDHPDGRKTEWPTVPRVGEFVAFNGRGGASVLKVTSVRYDANSFGVLQDIEVHLTC